MYRKGNIIYSEAGKYLRFKSFIALQFVGVEEEDITEEELDISKVEIRGSTAIVDRGVLRINMESADKAWLKPYIISLRYTNNDQMGVILNREDSEEGEMLYQKMQEWRRFADSLCKAILDKTNE